MISKKAKIVATAIKLFAKQGSTVATAKIAEEAGISNGSLFNYFPSKQILIDEVYLQIKTEIANCILADVAKAKTLKKFLFYLWNSYILWAIANPVKYNVVHLLKNSRVVSASANNKTEEIFKVANERIGKGIKDGEIINISLDYYCDLVTSQLMASISYLKSQNLRGKELEKHVNKGFEIYWNGVTKH